MGSSTLQSPQTVKEIAEQHAEIVIARQPYSYSGLKLLPI